MIGRNLSPEDVIRISLASAPGGEGQVARNELSARIVLLGLKLAGFQIVPADGAAASGAESGAGAGAESAAPQPPSGARPPRVPLPKPDVWPKHCTRCNKIVTDRGTAELCEQTECPL